MASCRQVESSLQAYLDEELAQKERSLVDEHLSDCHACGAALRRQRAVSGVLSESMTEHRLGRDLTGLVMAHLPEMDQSALLSRELTVRTKGSRQPRMWFIRLMPVWTPALVAALAIVMFRFWPQSPAIEDPRVGMVTYVKGSVLRSADNSTARHEVQVESDVVRATRFETQHGGRVQLTLSGPTHVKVAPATRVKIYDDRHLSVERGAVWLDVAKGSRYFRVNTPSGDITVFGTIFGVEVLNGRTMVTVLDGTVQVENGVAFTVLEHGEQVNCGLGEKPLVPYTVDAKAALAWAEMIQPETEALEHFVRTTPSSAGGQIPGEQVFLVHTHNETVHAIQFTWSRDAMPVTASGLNVYVYDALMNPLFKQHIEASVFRDASRTSYELEVPEAVRMQATPLLHIKAIADDASAGEPASFVKVTATGG